ncbi:MAG: hypothetical protein H7061_13120 [Bdellovibrionaceae bacterium]|nr:hypothetical protein [Bdellovibrio sp.]
MEKIRLSLLSLAVILTVGCSHNRVNKNTTTFSNGTANESPATQPTVGATTPPADNQLITQPGQPLPAAPSVNKSLPRFGFIFSGGGAKAWAHIGVLKELQKMKWPTHAVAGFEWGAVVAAVYAQNLSANEVEWEMSKLKDFDKANNFVKSVFDKKSTAELKVPFVCPSLNISKQSYFLLNRGQLDQLIPFCIAQPPLTAVHAQSVAVMSDVDGLAQFLRSTGANKIILVNVMASQNAPRAFVKDFESAENILWAQSAALMNRKPSGVDDVIQINLDDYGIKDLDRRRDLIAKGAELSYNQIKKLATKYGL